MVNINKNNPKINVANIIEDSRFGGPQKRIILVASYLKEKINTFVITSKKDSNNLFSFAKKNSIKLYLLPMNRISLEFFLLVKYIFFFLFDIFILIILLLRNNIDIVHVNSSHQYKGAIAAIILRKKLIWHLNDSYAPFLIRFIFSKLSPFANLYIFASKRTKNYYEELINKRIPSYIVPAVIDKNLFSPNFDFSKEIDTYNLPKDTFNVGMVANINPCKGIAFFLEIVAKFNSYKIPANFYIVGNLFPSQKSYYKKLLALKNELNIENLYFLGYKKNINYFLNQIDVFMCTSKFESSPTAIWEAMSMAKSVISTDVGDVKDYINHHSEKNFTVKFDDTYNFVDKLLYLHNNPDKRIEIGIKNREICLKHFSLEKVSELMEKIYSEV